ncbi:MAG: ATP-binding cassette domain-containing protein [Lachnospiraceae bacterium]
MLLECSGLKKSYGRKLAVRDITLNLEQGKIYGLLGPNGSGKTTWMKMVAGLVKGWEGSILFDGHALTYKDKAEITYMSTEPFFYSYMKIRDVGKYYSDFFADFSPERFEKLLMRMELDPKDKARTLSSGMAAKLKLAATLARAQGSICSTSH